MTVSGRLDQWPHKRDKGFGCDQPLWLKVKSCSPTSVSPLCDHITQPVGGKRDDFHLSCPPLAHSGSGKKKSLHTVMKKFAQLFVF